MRLESLLPPGDPVDPLERLAGTRPWDRVTTGRPYVLANMVASLDGRVALDGGSTGLGGEGDRAMFFALRGVVDAVLVGTATVRAETFGRLVASQERRAAREALGLAGDPWLVLPTRSGDVPWEAPLFDAPEQPVAVVCRPGAVRVPEGVRARVEVVEVDEPSPLAALAALQTSHGVRAALCEGGPTVLGALVAEGGLDELFLTLAPVLAGGATDALRIVAGLDVDAARRLRLEWVLRDGGDLLLRYTTTGAR